LNKDNAVLLVPTGIGASLGGYAGDAIPIARLLSEVVDFLITHPNVMNGAQLYWPISNALYVEGYALDRFARGDWYLQPESYNRVGLLLDKSIEPDLLLRHLQAADSTRATLGLNLTDYLITDESLDIELRLAPSGASWGTIGNPSSLLRGAQKLIQQAKADAIAIVTRFPEEPVDSLLLQSYREGSGVDPLSGAEAVISHLVVQKFAIPAAHAPALNPLPLSATLSPRAAAEEIGYTFLPSVLVGLSRAPRYLVQPEANAISASSVGYVITPASACGGNALLSFANQGATIIAVEENLTKMKVYPEMLGIKAIRVKSYLEAVGVIVAKKSGIAIESLLANLSPLASLN
jgi:hypothetical protein